MRNQPAVHALLAPLAAAGLLAGPTAHSHPQSHASVRHAVAQDTNVVVDSILPIPASVLTDTIETMTPVPASVLSGLVEDTTDTTTLRVIDTPVMAGPDSGYHKVHIRFPSSSITGKSPPLVIVDGKRVHATAPNVSPLDQINPSSIRTIEVLKGQTAVNRYGADAANGVVVVTTNALPAGQTPKR